MTVEIRTPRGLIFIVGASFSTFDKPDQAQSGNWPSNSVNSGAEVVCVARSEAG